MRPDEPGASPPFVFLHADLNSARVGGAVSGASMWSFTVVSEFGEIFALSGACVFWMAIQRMSRRCGSTYYLLGSCCSILGQ